MLVILTTHPIQYQTPLWRELTLRAPGPIEVWFLTDQGHRASHDAGFNRTFAWDIDLTAGYSYRFLRTRPSPPDIGRFLGTRIEGFGTLLKDRRVDALLVNGWFPQAYWQAVWRAKSAGIPVMLRAESNGLAEGPRWKEAAKRIVLGRFFERVDEFLAIGHANRRFYQSYGVPQARIGASPYCVDNDRFAGAAAVARPDRDALRARWGIPRDAVCFLFCGKLIPKKRVSDLLMAFERLLAMRASAGLEHPVHLLIAGDGVLRPAIEAHARRLSGHRPMVSLTGFLNQSEVPHAYVAADCLVLPSEATETWGLVVNEAMACGLPAIVSDRVGCGEDLIASGRNGDVFPLGDVCRFAETLQRWADPLRCAAAAPASLTKAAEYSVGRAADGILSGLDRVSAHGGDVRIAEVLR